MFKLWVICSAWFVLSPRDKTTVVGPVALPVTAPGVPLVVLQVEVQAELLALEIVASQQLFCEVFHPVPGRNIVFPLSSPWSLTGLVLVRGLDRALVQGLLPLLDIVRHILQVLLGHVLCLLECEGHLALDGLPLVNFEYLVDEGL